MDHAPLTTADLRVALFSGNYNYVRDGANQALNRLVGYLLRQGIAVRIYSPVVKEPAFPATGDLVGVLALGYSSLSSIGSRVVQPGRVVRHER